AHEDRFSAVFTIVLASGRSPPPGQQPRSLTSLPVARVRLEPWKRPDLIRFRYACEPSLSGTVGRAAAKRRRSWSQSRPRAPPTKGAVGGIPVCCCTSQLR